MPIISKFFGIVIKIHSKDHGPPHFHAEYQGFEAVYDIKTGDRMEGYFPRKQNRIVMVWAKKYGKELLESWKLIQEEREIRPIEGAKK